MSKEKNNIVTEIPTGNDFIADVIYRLSGDEIRKVIQQGKQQLLRELIADLEGSYPEYHMEIVKQWLDIDENGI
jgi:hypothetical protein